MLGTLITEWQDGSAKCAAMLADDARAERCAVQLAALAAYFGFDGWLVNIENELPLGHVQRTLQFLR